MNSHFCQNLNKSELDRWLLQVIENLVVKQKLTLGLQIAIFKIYIHENFR